MAGRGCIQGSPQEHDSSLSNFTCSSAVQPGEDSLLHTSDIFRPRKVPCRHHLLDSRSQFFEVTHVNVRGDAIRGYVGLVGEVGRQLTTGVISLSEVGLGPGHLDKCAVWAVTAGRSLTPVTSGCLETLSPSPTLTPSRGRDAAQIKTVSRRNRRHNGSKVLASENLNRPSTQAPGRQAPQRRMTCGHFRDRLHIRSTIPGQTNLTKNLTPPQRRRVSGRLSSRPYMAWSDDGATPEESHPCCRPDSSWFRARRLPIPAADATLVVLNRE